MSINRILHIDDDPDTRSLLKHYLEAEGYAVLQADDGTSGLELAEAEQPDLILLDLALPSGNGLDVLRKLKQGPLMEVPVIVVSMLCSEMRRKAALAAKATAFVPKPIDRVALMTALRDCAGEATMPGMSGAPVAPVPSAVTAADGDTTSERITVSIMAGLGPLIPTYMQRRRNDVADLAEALERDDFPAIETIGHRMRGNGASMGFMKISAIGEALELSAPEADRAAIETLRLELLNFLDHVDIAYE